MIVRAALCALWAVALAPAALRISVMEHDTERILVSAYTLAPAEVGSVVPVKFHIRAGAEPALLERIELISHDLVIVSKPTLPIVLWPGAYVEVNVEYRPAVPGGGSGTLRVNERTITIVTQALPAPLIRVAGGDVLRVGLPLDFGEVQLGSSVSRTLVIENPFGERATVSRLEVVGAGFPAAIPPVPFQLDPGASMQFDVTFEPQSEGLLGASLYLNSREYTLRGTAIAPPIERPVLEVEPASPRSGQQARLRVRLPSPPSWPADGVLRMAFEGPADPTVRLLNGDGRAVAFHIPAGETVARFGNATAADFQTGSTAGRIIFTVELRSYREQLTIDLAPARFEFDTATAKRASSSVSVRFTGFDNTRSASELAFTFYDISGRRIGSGPIRVNAASEFRTYFDSSSYGGTFSLRAEFPVRGPIEQIGSVDIEVLNTQGTARRSVTITE